MTNRTLTQNQEDEALAFGEVAAPSSMTAASPGSVIIQFRPRTAAAMPWSDDAGELDEDVFPLGSLAVKLVGTFRLPRLLVVRQDLGAGCDPIAPPF